MLYPAAKLTTTELGYAVTGHTGQGGTVTCGEAVFRGGEPREWAYVALTRGRERNTARVITQVRAADPGAGTQADPELARADLLRRERAGLRVGAGSTSQMRGSRWRCSLIAWDGRRARTRRPSTSARAWSGPITSACCTPAGPTR